MELSQEAQNTKQTTTLQFKLKTNLDHLCLTFQMYLKYVVMKW